MAQSRVVTTPAIRHPNRHIGRTLSLGQHMLLQRISYAARDSNYQAPSPRTVLVRVKGKLPPFSTALQCYWMNGKGRPNVYAQLEV